MSHTYFHQSGTYQTSNFDTPPTYVNLDQVEFDVNIDRRKYLPGPPTPTLTHHNTFDTFQSEPYNPSSPSQAYLTPPQSQTQSPIQERLASPPASSTSSPSADAYNYTTSTPTSLPSPTPPPHQTPEIHRCPSCSRSYHRKGELQKHWYARHEKRFFCTVPDCGRGFGLKTDLKKHEKTHVVREQKDLVVCEVEGCGVSFGRRDNMLKHVKKMHGGR